MAELDYITVEGFKSIASIEKLKLGPLTALIGPNGSGKSNFLGVFSFLNAIRQGRLQEYVLRAGGAERVLHFGSRVTKQVRVHISFDGEVNQYEVSLAPDNADRLVVAQETAYFWDKARYPSRPYETGIPPIGLEAGISGQPSGRIEAYLQSHLDSWRLYHFHDAGFDSPMKKTADVNDNRYLRSDGSNLAPFLYLLREKRPDSYNLILGTVRQAAPFFRDFRLEPQLLNPDKMRLEWIHDGTDAYFDASSLSDGTLRFIALASLFLQPSEYRPSVILVDEPELGMHPYAITLLASLMKQASTEAQVVVSTQSSLLLDHFEPEEILVAERVNGATEFTRLDASRLAPWLESYSLGQLWEKNELGGRPRPE